jgi:hypothetical protein
MLVPLLGADCWPTVGALRIGGGLDERIDRCSSNLGADR